VETQQGQGREEGASPVPSNGSSEDGGTPRTPRKIHGMSSTFELGDEQPEPCLAKSRKARDDSFNALFGPPPESPRARKAWTKKVKEQEVAVQRQRNKKPLPVNPLTGDILGVRVEREAEIVQGSPERDIIVQTQTNIHNKSGGQTQARRPPGGHHSPLW